MERGLFQGKSAVLRTVLVLLMATIGLLVESRPAAGAEDGAERDGVPPTANGPPASHGEESGSANLDDRAQLGQESESSGSKAGSEDAEDQLTVGDLFPKSDTGGDAGVDGAGTDDSDGSGWSLGAIDGEFGAEYLRALGWLAFVVGLIVLLAFLVKRVVPGARRRGESRLIQVLARTPISPKQQLMVVRIADRALVLGISPERIEKVCEMSDPREVIALSQQEGFDAELDKQRSRFAAAPSNAAPTADAGDGDEELEPYRHEIERLKTLVGGWRASAAHKTGNGDLSSKPVEASGGDRLRGVGN